MIVRVCSLWHVTRCCSKACLRILLLCMRLVLMLLLLQCQRHAAARVVVSPAVLMHINWPCFKSLSLLVVHLFLTHDKLQVQLPVHRQLGQAACAPAVSLTSEMLLLALPLYVAAGVAAAQLCLVITCVVGPGKDLSHVTQCVKCIVCGGGTRSRCHTVVQ